MSNFELRAEYECALLCTVMHMKVCREPRACLILTFIVDNSPW